MRYANLSIFLALTAIAGLMAAAALAADYTRDGGTADWMCCADRDCATIISQHADPVRAFRACEKLTDGDGRQRYTRSNAFRVTASAKVEVPPSGVATLRWVTPTQRENGQPLTDLSGYDIVYGREAAALTHAARVGAVNEHRFTGLEPGTWYFAVITLTPTERSAPSNVANKVVL